MQSKKVLKVMIADERKGIKEYEKILRDEKSHLKSLEEKLRKTK